MTIKITEEGGLFVAVARWKFKGKREEVASQGRTRRAALRNVLEAVELLEED